MYKLTNGVVVVGVRVLGILLLRTIWVGFRRELRGPSGEDVVSRRASFLWWGDVVPETLDCFVDVVVFFITLFLLLATFTGIADEDDDDDAVEVELVKGNDSLWNQSISVCAFSGLKLPWNNKL